MQNSDSCDYSALWRVGRLPAPPRARRRLPVLSLRWLWGMLRLRCSHRRLTWPQTRWVGPEHSRRQVTTQCCLGCGREFEYRGELVTNQ